MLTAVADLWHKKSQHVAVCASLKAAIEGAAQPYHDTLSPHHNSALWSACNIPVVRHGFGSFLLFNEFFLAFPLNLLVDVRKLWCDEVGSRKS